MWAVAVANDKGQYSALVRRSKPDTSAIPPAARRSEILEMGESPRSQQRPDLKGTLLFHLRPSKTRTPVAFRSVGSASVHKPNHWMSMCCTGLCHILRVASGQKLKPVLHLERHYPRLPEEQWSYFRYGSFGRIPGEVWPPPCCGTYA